MIYLYHVLNILLLPVYLIVIFIRIIIGKEDINRVSERFAFSYLKRNSGILIWIHAASVGESGIALTLVENINKIAPEFCFLVTSGTRSSAEMLQKKLPKNAIHQFLPSDNIIFVKKFLNNWQPNLGIFVESELWPCLLCEASKYCKLLLLNARISDKSFKLWKKITPAFRLIINNFSEIITQSHTDFNKFNALGGSNLINTGNIKFVNKKLDVDTKEFASLEKHFQDKKIILFASTHTEDEKVIFEVIRPLKEQYPNCYFILIPRHPERINDIFKVCNSLNFKYNIRSKGSAVNLNDDIYIIDKFGEMGLFFSLAYITFIGGTFKQGGHNILEPAYFGNCIIFGPDMSNNSDLAKEILENKAAIQIQNSYELLAKLKYLLSVKGEEEVTMYKKKSLAFIEQNQQILENYLAIIKKYI